MIVLAIVRDLMFESRIREAAKGVGADLRVVKRGEAPAQACREHEPALVVVDLDGFGIDGVAVTRAIRADAGLETVPIVGFFNHAHGERAEAALRAGCTRVISRGAFVAELPALLCAATPA